MRPPIFLSHPLKSLLKERRIVTSCGSSALASPGPAAPAGQVRMGRFAAEFDAFVGYGYEINLEKVYEDLPRLVKCTSHVASLKELCVETLLQHKDMAAHAMADPRLEPFEQVLRTGDFGLLLKMEQRSSQLAAGRKKAKVEGGKITCQDEEGGEGGSEERNELVEPCERSEKDGDAEQDSLDSMMEDGLFLWESEEIQDAANKAVARLWPAYESSLTSAVVEVVFHAGWEEPMYTRRVGNDPPDRMFLLLKDKGFRYSYCELECDSTSAASDMSISALDTWTITKARYLLGLPSLAVSPAYERHFYYSPTTNRQPDNDDKQKRAAESSSSGSASEADGPCWIYGSLARAAYW